MPHGMHNNWGEPKRAYTKNKKQKTNKQKTKIESELFRANRLERIT